MRLNTIAAALLALALSAGAAAAQPAKSLKEQIVGTWTVDEDKKTVTYTIVSSSFPNWEGEAQTRNIDKLNAEEFVNTNPNVGGGRGSASNFYRRVK